MKPYLAVSRATIVTTAAVVALTQSHGQLRLFGFLAAGYAVCWLRRDHRITRLARRCNHFEDQWRKARHQRDFYQRELELADAENAQLQARVPGLAVERAVVSGHPCMRSAGAKR